MRDGPLKWPHRRVGVLNPNSRGHTKKWESLARRANVLSQSHCHAHVLHPPAMSLAMHVSPPQEMVTNRNGHGSVYCYALVPICLWTTCLCMGSTRWTVTQSERAAVSPCWEAQCLPTQNTNTGPTHQLHPEHYFTCQRVGYINRGPAKRALIFPPSVDRTSTPRCLNKTTAQAVPLLV